MKCVNIALAAAALGLAAPVVADDHMPMKPAEYVEFTGIHIDDGHGLEYARHLAGQWRKSNDFAMSQGWISGYEILLNVHARSGEPDVYLLVRFEEMATPEQMRERTAAYRAHMEASMEEMEAGSAARSEYRTIGSEMLLRRMVWND